MLEINLTTILHARSILALRPDGLNLLDKIIRNYVTERVVQEGHAQPVVGREIVFIGTQGST